MENAKMIRSPTQLETCKPLDEYNKYKEPPRITISSNTRYQISDQILFVQGQHVIDSSGERKVMVSIDPGAIDRKLAIRELNAQLEGRIINSQTFAKI
jgi:hypothetical protein